ncbi:MAG TPA: peroxiredoxin [Wenzhouxiangella sp.]
MIQVGDHIPDTPVMQMTENGPSPIAASEVIGTGRVVLFATPGAFTPTCSAQHLPGFLEKHDELKAKGIDQLVCMAVNDVFVVDAWSKASQTADKVTMIADGNGDFARAMGLEMDIRAFGMGDRCQRFAMIIQDGVVEDIMIEAPGEFKVSSAEAVLNKLS